jgi:hypothetical protein
MRWPFKVLGALAAAGIVATSTSAFTASNTMPSGGVAGYGQTTSTGATITAFSQTTVVLDASRLASVTFSSATNVTGKTAKMTLKSGNTLVGTSYACSLGGYVLGTMSITCNTPDNPLLNTFDTRGLSVV